MNTHNPSDIQTSTAKPDENNLLDNQNGLDVTFGEVAGARPSDEDAFYEEARKQSKERSDETSRRIDEVKALSDDQKTAKILDLEDSLKYQEKIDENLEKENQKLKRKNTAKNVAFSGLTVGFVALGAVMCSMLKDAKENNQHLGGEVVNLEGQLRGAVLLDEANSKSVRAYFANQVALAVSQKTDATPSEAVGMALNQIKEQKSRGDVALEEFQIRVIGEDLRVLAAAAERTKTNTPNFLTALSYYAQAKPNAYANKSTPVVSSRDRLDALLIKDGLNRENSRNGNN